MSAPERFSETADAEADRRESSKPLLAYFIGQYDGRGICAHRLQKLLFYAEATYYREHETRLTTVEWKPYMYGMYAKEIGDALDEIVENGGDSIPGLRHGDRTELYLDTPSNLFPDDEIVAFLDDIHSETEEISTSDLVNWTKEHPLYTGTRYAEPADFTTYNP